MQIKTIKNKVTDTLGHYTGLCYLAGGFVFPAICIHLVGTYWGGSWWYLAVILTALPAMVGHYNYLLKIQFDYKKGEFKEKKQKKLKQYGFKK